MTFVTTEYHLADILTTDCGHKSYRLQTSSSLEKKLESTSTALFKGERRGR